MSNAYNTLVSSSQKGRLIFLLKDSIIYGLVGAINKLLMIITFPIIVRFFSKEEFGQIDATTYLVSLFLPLILIGLDSSVARFFYEVQTDSEKKQIISEAFFFFSCFMIVLCGLLLWAAPFIQYHYIGTNNLNTLYRILVLTLPARAILVFTMGVLKWTLRRNEFLIISLGSSLLVVVLTLLLLEYSDLSKNGIGWASLVGHMLFVIPAVLLLRKELKWPRQFIYIRRMLKFGLPYAGSSFLMLFILSTDRFVLSNFLTNSQVGLSNYSVAFKLASFTTIATLGFQTAWGPFAFSLHKNETANHSYNLSLKWFSFFIASLAVGICAFAQPLIILFATDKYISSYYLVLPILYGFVFDAVAQMTFIGIDLSKKTHFFIICHIISWLLGYAVMRFLAPYYAEIGVAYGFMVLKATFFLVATYIGHRVYPQVKFKLTLPLIVIVSAFVYIFLVTHIIQPLLTLSIRAQFLFASFNITFFGIFFWLLFIGKHLKLKNL
jgi:O-antigen/teichoic acid export membrane protein